MNPPLTREELRQLLLKRIKKQQAKAVPGTGVVLSRADNLLMDRKPRLLAYLEGRYLHMRKELGADENALRVVLVEFVRDVSESVETGRTYEWIIEDRKTNLHANRRAHVIDHVRRTRS